MASNVVCTPCKLIVIETVELVHRNILCVLNKPDIGWYMKLFRKIFDV
jgi:hypothetical protein